MLIKLTQWVSSSILCSRHTDIYILKGDAELVNPMGGIHRETDILNFPGDLSLLSLIWDERWITPVHTCISLSVDRIKWCDVTWSIKSQDILLKCTEWHHQCVTRIHIERTKKRQDTRNCLRLTWALTNGECWSKEWLESMNGKAEIQEKFIMSLISSYCLDISSLIETGKMIHVHLGVCE